jgi:hypothetical protein
MWGKAMDDASQLILTAQTLILAKQTRAEAAADGNFISEDDAVSQAIQLIQTHRRPITDRFVRYF